LAPTGAKLTQADRLFLLFKYFFGPMQNKYILLLVSLFLLKTTLSTAQSATVQLNGHSMRQILELPVGSNAIRVCGLSPGKIYSLIANPAAADQKAQFEWALDPDLGAQIDPERPQRMVIVANAECVTVTLGASTPERASTLPMYLSLRCLDCPEANAWLDDFQSQVEAANLTTTGNVSASNLVTNVLIGGNCFEVTNVTSSGNNSSRGTFANGATNIGINNGAILCTGNVNIVTGANNNNAAYGGYSFFPSGDPDLSTLATTTQYDMSRIEFDFRPTSPTVQFDFVFGSEEYCEFVNSNFNDVFGFFISGPGIAGTQNIALIPSTSTPVAINNVNQTTNSAYFVNNNNFPGTPNCVGMPMQSPTECQLDGWTSVFTATAEVIPCSTYHIKLAIADVGDDAYASAVFLRANSFDAGGQAGASAVYPSGGGQFVVEGCGGQGFIRFTRTSTNLTQPFVINYTIAPSSTAEPGVDYTPLPNPIIIPAGQSSIQIPVNVLPDLIFEDNETITLVIENACSCSQDEVTFNIQDIQPMTLNMSDVEGCGNQILTLLPNAFAGQTPYTYQWSTGATSATLNVSAPGVNTYTVTVTDACGRTATAEAVSTIAPSPTASLTGSGAFCVGGSNSANLVLNMTGDGPWEVVWNANGVPQTAVFDNSPSTINITQPGTYTLVSVTASNGCTGTVTSNVNLQNVNVNLAATANNPPCFGQNGSISTTPSGGTAPYTYAWSPSGSGQNPNNLPPGTYNVTVTSNQGCTETAQVTIVEPPELTLSPSTPANIDCITPSTSVSLNPSGGTPNYTYAWSNSSTSPSPAFTTPGTYTVTVRDSRNCTETASITVTGNTTQPTASIAAVPPLNCNVSSATINGLGSSQGPDFSYSWSGPGIVSGGNTLQPQVNQGGTYVLTVTNTTNNCTRTASVTVANNNALPNAFAAAPTNISCSTPTVTLSGSGSAAGPGIVYQWTTPNGNIVSGATGLNPVVNQAGTYTLLVTNNNTGCTNQQSVNITGNTQVPTAAIAPTGTINCITPLLTLDASGSSQGPFTYNWTAGPGGIITGGNGTLNLGIAAGGNYTLVVTNPSNNCTASATITVPGNLSPPNAVIAPTGGINCQNSSVTLNANGSSTGPNFSFEWLTNGGNIVSGANTLTPVVNQGGNYTIIVTNNTNGCTRQASVTVPQDQSVPQANAGNDRVINCLASSVQLTGSGTTGPGYTFAWTASPGGFQSGQNTLTPTVNQAGNYTLVITNTATGCTSSDNVQVTVNLNTPDAQILPPPVLSCVDNQVLIDATPSTAGPDISYAWSTTSGQILGPNNEPTVTAGSIGTYRLTITDTESGCTDVAQVTVTRNVTPPNVEAGNGGSLTCQNPTFTLNAAGTSTGPNFTFEWQVLNGNILSGENTLTPVVDAAGLYTLVVTNETNGCTASDNVSVTASQNFPVAAGGPDLVLDCNQPTAVINGINSSSGPGIQYLWSASPGNITQGANTRTPTINQAGVYTLLLTNTTNGCTATDVVEVTSEIAYPVPVLQTPPQLDCNVVTVELDALNSTQVGNAQYQWTTSNGYILLGANSPTPQVNEPGTYSLVITNADNGCTATAQMTVNQDIAQPNAMATAPNALSCQNPQVALSGNGSSTGLNFEYAWSSATGNIVSGAQTLSPQVNQPGTYVLTVTNAANGCSRTASASVQTSQALPTANSGPAQLLTCVVGSISLDGSLSSQGSDFAYVWSTQNGNIVSGGNSLSPTVDAPGTYELVVVNQQNGCTATAVVAVGTDYATPTAVVAPGGILSCTVSSLGLSGNGSSMGSQFSYNWTTQNGNILSGSSGLNPTVNAVGAYTLVVTNTTNGCSSSAETQVQADASLPLANAGTPDTLTCTVTEVAINALASSQGSQYSYAWSGPDNVAATTGLQPLVSEPGEYQLIVTNTTNGCTALSAVTIVRDVEAPLAEAGTSAVLTCTQTALSLDGNGSSSGPLFQYQWTASNGGQISAGANTSTPEVNQPGTYTLLVRNNFNNCTATDQVQITQDVATPNAEAGPPATITCLAPTITIAGQGSSGPLFQYQWTTADGNIASGGSTLSPVADAPGTYNLLVTNIQNGCTATDNVSIGIDANVPTASAEVNGQLSCAVGELQLSGQNSTQAAGISYTWQASGGGNIVAGANTLNPTVDAPGQYTLQVLNTVNSCQAFSTVEVLENLTPPDADAGNPAILSCSTPVITLDGSGSSTGSNFSYNWTTTDGNILSGADTQTPNVDQSGFYALVVTDLNNGCSAQSSVQILLDQNTPEADAGPSPTLTCAVSSLQLDGTESSAGSQFSFLWTTQDGQILSGNTSLTPTIGAPGTYNLLISNVNNGCLSEASVVVNQDVQPPAAQAGNDAGLSCAVQSTQLNVTGSSTGGNFIYNWTTSNGLITNGANTPTPTVADPGLYNLLVTNTTTGCTNTASVTVPEDLNPPMAAASVSGELTCAVTTLNLSAAGSSNNATYAWSTTNGNILTGGNSANPTVDESGTYNLLVTNNLNGCTSSASVNVPQNTQAPQVDATVSAQLTCAITQVQLQGSGSGSSQGVEFAWSGPGIVGSSDIPNPTVNATGQYTLTATDLYNGCTASDAVTVGSNTTPPTVAIATPGLLTCATTQTNLSAAGSSQGSQYTYAWTGPGLLSGATTASPLINQPGTYTLLITNTLNGCQNNANTLVQQNIQAPVAQAGGAFELTCSNEEGLLSAEGSSSGQPFQYTWSSNNGYIVSGASSAAPLVNQAGLYTLVVTNTQTGCSSSATVSVVENTNYPSDLEFLIERPKCGEQPGSITVQEVSGGVGPYLYSVDNGDNFLTANDFLGLPPGSYPVVVQDANGCEYEEIVNLPVPAEPSVSLPTEIKLVFGESALLTAALNIPLSQVDSIVWSPTEGLTSTSKLNEVIARPFRDTEYTVRVVNEDGCEALAKVLLRVSDPRIWAPNTIKLGNGENGRFLIFASDQTINKINSLQIHDRWGTMVFRNDNLQPNDPSAGWDGSYKGATLQPAVFVWWAEVELADGSQILLKGDVTVVR
jgi:hypothetical protein